MFSEETRKRLRQEAVKRLLTHRLIEASSNGWETALTQTENVHRYYVRGEEGRLGTDEISTYDDALEAWRQVVGENFEESVEEAREEVEGLPSALLALCVND